MRAVNLHSIDEQKPDWWQHHQNIDVVGRETIFTALIADLVAQKPLNSNSYRRVMRRYVQQGLPWLSKDQLLQVYRELCRHKTIPPDNQIITQLQMKPTRTQAGVTTVTVLTKPYPCPGKCIFCPTDVRMPKSYLHDEPGAMRAERHNFDPYEQTLARLTALHNIGHPTQKVELLILGGTWSSYRRDYQEWFVKRCFDALNQTESPTLAQAQALNTVAKSRNVGLVIETRPDHITPEELRWLRYLGVTKVQIGIQSLDDQILESNKRGHDVQTTRNAIRLLRLAGYKIHAHWMPNLLGATPESDLEDFARLWQDPAIRPDELKIYPCMLVENAELYDYWLRGEYKPYSEEEVIRVLVGCKKQVPRWVRINRVVRDIPTTNVVEGMKKANLRQIAQEQLRQQGTPCQCIRCREIQRQEVRLDELHLTTDHYETDATTEYFLSYERADGRIAGFLRLSLPDAHADLPLPELADHAMIREVHVYGPALSFGEGSHGEAQHIGLGRQLIQKAQEIARANGYTRLAVISAIGTQQYYVRHGFQTDGLYMTMGL